MDHNLTVKEKLSNFPDYRWEVDCSCGWAGKGPTEQVAKSLGTNHGGTLPVKLVEEKEEEKVKEPVVVTVAPKPNPLTNPKT